MPVIVNRLNTSPFLKKALPLPVLWYSQPTALDPVCKLPAAANAARTGARPDHWGPNTTELTGPERALKHSKNGIAVTEMAFTAFMNSPNIRALSPAARARVGTIILPNDPDICEAGTYMIW
jgi:hypothetical protein